jgi:predicted nucleic acid-binding protein
VTAEVFVDTSALYAALDRNDRHHGEAAPAWQGLIDQMRDEEVAAVTHSGVVTEAVALVQSRLGLDAARALLDELLPEHDVMWIDASLHAQATAALLAAGRREVSLVDWTSFEVMRTRAIDVAFAFDGHFWEQGFRSYTAGS